ncbi:calcium proton exchanger [Diplodia corticola]|uniref:Calcium proton exchanger n=1 Tax=Diplodia corticola TaxID=236234 RepID=A0A1J9RQD8_9PEZI|nr:calcium proton exchanger [Diplodia corticola]OJD29765.1 calcium proton exchanger [Diplodia corticola]
MDEESRPPSQETIGPNASLDFEPITPSPIVRPSQVFNQLTFPKKLARPTLLVVRQRCPVTRADEHEDDERQPLLPHRNDEQRDLRSQSCHDSAIEVYGFEAKNVGGLDRLLTVIRRVAASMALAAYHTISFTTKLFYCAARTNLSCTSCFLIFVPLGLLSSWMGWGPVVVMLLNALAVSSAAFMTSALFEDMGSIMPGPSIHAFIADMLFSNVAWLCVGIFALSNEQYPIIAFIIPGSILTRSLLGLGLGLISGGLSSRIHHDDAPTMALYSSLKMAGLVPFFICSLLTLAFRNDNDNDNDDHIPQSPDSRDHMLFFSRGSAIVSLIGYLLAHLFLNITHAAPVPPTPPTVPRSAAERTAHPRSPIHHPTPTLAFLASLLFTILASNNLVHALATLSADSHNRLALAPLPSPCPNPLAMTTPFFHSVLLPLLLNHAELVAAIKVPHRHLHEDDDDDHHRRRNRNPHHVLAVLTEAPTAHAALALVPSLVLLAWIFGGRDVGLEIGRFGGGGGGGGGGGTGKGEYGHHGPSSSLSSSSSSATLSKLLMLLLCGLGAWVGSIVVAGRRGGRLMVLKGSVLVSLYIIMATAVFLLP